MVTLDEFSASVVKGLQEKAPEYIYDLRDDVDGSDGSLHTGIFVSKDENSFAMGIDLEEKYASMTASNGSIDDVIDDLIKGIQYCFEKVPSMDDFMSQYFSDYNDAKEHLVMNLIPISGNDAMLSEMPHRVLGDMALTYAVQAWSDDQPFNEFPVLNNLQGKFNISAEQLDRDARISAPNERKAVLRELGEVVTKMEGRQPEPITDPDGNEIKILLGTTTVEENADDTTRGMSGGAAVIFYPGFLDSVAELAGGDFYILPLSVGYVLFLPITETVDLDVAGSLATSFYASISPEHKLSNLMLSYNSTEHKIADEAYQIV